MSKSFIAFLPIDVRDELLSAVSGVVTPRRTKRHTGASLPGLLRSLFGCLTIRRLHANAVELRENGHTLERATLW